MLKKIILITLLPLLILANETRVINGDTVSDDNNMWKFIVSLKQYGSHYCGGSIIKQNWVLTAAHCLSDDYGNVNPVDAGDSVGSGAYNLNDMTEYSVKRYIIHPDYNSLTTDNDIALIELNSSITNITPITYDTSHTLEADTRTMLAGWGNMDSNDGISFPDGLQEALLPIVDFDVCNSDNSYEGDLTQNMFCAGYLDARRDGCQGDSGGPLIVDNTVVGIVSWGNGCAEEDFPGVYTKVQNYAAWIANTTKVIVPLKPTKPSAWIPIMIGDIITFVPNPLH